MSSAKPRAYRVAGERFAAWVGRTRDPEGSTLGCNCPRQQPSRGFILLAEVGSPFRGLRKSSAMVDIVARRTCLPSAVCGVHGIAVSPFEEAQMMQSFSAGLLRANLSLRRCTLLAIVSCVCLVGCAVQVGDPGPLDEEPLVAELNSPLSSASREAEGEEWAGVVAISLPTGGVCTGVLLHPVVVLTAAHCVAGLTQSDLPPSGQAKVYGGPSVKSRAERVFYSDIESVVVPADWDGDLDSLDDVDLALAQLKQPVNGVPVHALPDSSVLDTDRGVVVGYGRTGSTSEESPGVKRIGEAAILGSSGNYFEFGEPTTACSGDSGGPFFVADGEEWVVGGIISFDESEGVCDSETSWAVDVTRFTEWLGEQKRQMEQTHASRLRSGCAMMPSGSAGGARSALLLLTALVLLGRRAGRGA